MQPPRTMRAVGGRWSATCIHRAATRRWTSRRGCASTPSRRTARWPPRSSASSASAQDGRRSTGRSATMHWLLAMADGECDPLMLNSIAVGFGHIGDERCVEPLVRMHTYADAEVQRWSLVGYPTRSARSCFSRRRTAGPRSVRRGGMDHRQNLAPQRRERQLEHPLCAIECLIGQAGLAGAASAPGKPISQSLSDLAGPETHVGTVASHRSKRQQAGSCARCRCGRRPERQASGETCMRSIYRTRQPLPKSS
jgi:hypothetical protein